MKVLGLIPARGGSKGVPRKNVRPLAGIPLIAHTIRAAFASERLTDVVVTTDDDEIAAIAAAEGARVLRRPADLAADTTPMPPVAFHALDFLAGERRAYDVLMLLQCTCPARTGADIAAALDRLKDSGADAVISVTRVDDTHPARMYRIADDRLTAFDPAFEGMRRQDLPALYLRSGVIYGIRTQAFQAERTFFSRNAVPIELPRERSVNIDNELDFQFADFLMRQAHGAHS